MESPAKPPRPRRFTPSATHQVVHAVDKFHLGLAWLALGLRREAQQRLPLESAGPKSAGRT